MVVYNDSSSHFIHRKAQRSKSGDLQRGENGNVFKWVDERRSHEGVAK